jgi:branched-chain amino acid transport system permease protein
VMFLLLKELLSSHVLIGAVAEHWQLTLGLTIIAFVALMPQGLIGMTRRWRRR